MLEVLFREILEDIGVSGRLEKADTPTIFSIYAHDNPTYDQANSRIVRQLLDGFRIVGSNTRSDRRPVLGARTTIDEEDGPAMHDSLHNQACHLPQTIASNPMDKVVLCYSEVLQRYCNDMEGRAYVRQFEDMCLQGLNQMPVNIHDIQEKISDFVESKANTKGFHHVLTEMAMVKVRIMQDKNHHSIIPVLLNKLGEIHLKRELPFLKSTQNYLIYKETSSMMHPSQALHRLFFRLLQRIYGTLVDLGVLLYEMYEEGIRRLDDNQDLSMKEFKMELKARIFDELKRATRYRKPELREIFSE